MKKLMIFTVLLIAGSFCCCAIDNKSAEFVNTFNQAVINLRFERFSEALVQLKELDKLDEGNPNIKYLMGVCLIASNTDNDKALEYLENAIQYRSNEYIPSYYLEKRTPIYSLYYLGVCYATMKRCSDAKKMFDQFNAIISDSSNDYVQDAISRLKECTSLTDTVRTVAQQQPLKITVPLKGNPDLIKGLKTRKVVFHKQDPLYAVQIGAFSQKLPNTNFPNLKNVKSFVDKDAVIRYIVGGTSIRATAEALEKAIVSAGYKDAFIVDITEKAKFDQEVLNAYDMEKSAIPIKKWAKLEYRVQIGAYRTREKMNEDMAIKFIKVEGISLLTENEMTLLTVGGFTNYDDAKNYKKILLEQGVPDAFVIVYKNGQKTSTKEAESFTSKDF